MGSMSRWRRRTEEYRKYDKQTDEGEMRQKGGKRRGRSSRPGGRGG